MISIIHVRFMTYSSNVYFILHLGLHSGLICSQQMPLNMDKSRNNSCISLLAPLFKSNLCVLRTNELYLFIHIDVSMNLIKINFFAAGVSFWRYIWVNSIIMSCCITLYEVIKKGGLGFHLPKSNLSKVTLKWWYQKGKY
jgi:hypothetical protein